MDGYYVLNRATGRLELHFSQQDYREMSEPLKLQLKRACLFAKSIPAWVSRTSTGKSHWAARQVAKALGLEDRGEEGERPGFAERQQAKQERAGGRAERMEGRAADAQAEAQARFDSQNIQTVRDLMGQPILVGHHSEKRHRRLLERADDDMRKGVEAAQRSEHYQRRAEAAERTAQAGQLKNVAFLQRRIEECETELRLLGRRAKEAQEKGDAAWLDRLADLAEEEEDKLAFYRERMDEAGGVKYGPDKLAVGDRVKVRRYGWWAEVVRCNPKTVTVRFVEGPLPQALREAKYPYAEVSQHFPRAREG